MTRIPDSGQSREDSKPRSLMALEPLILILAPILLNLLSQLLPKDFSLFGTNLDLKLIQVEHSEFQIQDLITRNLSLAYWIAVLPVLLLSRLRRLPAAAIFFSVIVWIIGFTCFAYMRVSAPAYNELLAYMPKDMRPDPWIFVPLIVMPLCSIARIIVPFFVGLLVAGHHFRLLKFAVGYFLSALAIDALYNARHPLAVAPFFASFTLTGLSCGLWVLPGQRIALARIFNVALPESESSVSPTTSSFLYRGILMLFGLILTLLVALGGAVGYVERHASAVIENGPPPIHRSPALLNAKEVLKPLFAFKHTERALPFDSDNIPNPFSGHVLPHIYPPELAELAIRKTRPEDLAEYFEYFDPLIQAMENARNADYLYYPGGYKRTPLIVIRATARALAFRAIVRLSEGRPEEAAQDIDTLFRFGTLLQVEGTQIQYVIGTAVISIATVAAYEYYLWNRDQPEKLDILISIMDQVAPNIHRSFDFEMIRRSEPSWWSIALYPEVSAPGLIRSVELHYFKWLEFDLMLVAMKLELYRAANGSYPDSLDQLIPKYITRIPTDPADGGAWTYKNLGTEFDLTTATHEQMYQGEPMERMFKLWFPTSEVDKLANWAEVEDWNPSTSDSKEN